MTRAGQLLRLTAPSASGTARQHLAAALSVVRRRIVGADDLVARDADDYVRIATRLVDDAAWRASLRESIRAGLDRIFETRAPVDAFAELLLAD